MGVGKNLSYYLVRHIFFATLFLILMGCASSKKTVSTETLTGPEKQELRSDRYDESFDPLPLEDDDIVIGRKIMEKETEADSHKDAVSPREELSRDETAFREVNGFRIQIFASRNIEAATLAESKAREDFANLGYSLYMIFEAPFYKLRIGDFKERRQAEEFLEQVRRMGYREAFIVRCKVRVPQD